MKKPSILSCIGVVMVVAILIVIVLTKQKAKHGYQDRLWPQTSVNVANLSNPTQIVTKSEKTAGSTSVVSVEDRLIYHEVERQMAGIILKLQDIERANAVQVQDQVTEKLENLVIRISPPTVEQLDPVHLAYAAAFDSFKEDSPEQRALQKNSAKSCLTSRFIRSRLRLFYLVSMKRIRKRPLRSGLLIVKARRC